MWDLVKDSAGRLYIGTGVYRTPDNGQTWTFCDSGMTSVNVWTITVNANGEVFVGTTDGGVFRSTDHGDSWTAVNSGLTMPYPFDLAVNADGEIFCATYYGIFRTTDNGDNWEDVSSGIGAVFVRSIAFADDGTAFAGPDNGYVYRHSSITGIKENSPSELPAAFSLNQNYPNPFNGGTRIEYSLSHTTRVSLEVFDISGRLIKTLTDGVVQPGNRAITICSDDFESGIYLYRLQTNTTGQSMTRKMTILK